MNVMTQSLSASLLLFAVAGNANASCDLSGLDCWGDDSKCNIHFANNTGKTTGSGSHQISMASTVEVKAVREDGSKAGNKLTILAGQTNTMNLDNKVAKDFDSIKMRVTTANMGRVSLTCEKIQTLLEAGDKCKLYIRTPWSEDDMFDYNLAYSCSGGVQAKAG